MSLPYAFAKGQGVVLEPRGADWVCLHRAEADLEALVEAQRVAGGLVALEEVTAEAFEVALGQQYRDSASEAAEAAAGDEIGSLADAAAIDDLLDRNDDAPVVRLINAMLLEAVKAGASDVHIESEEARLVVRFRVDGRLRQVLEPRRSLAPLLVSRIKVMGKLDIAEKRLAGRMAA